jgi:2-polyprenyl-3-methyl-5-hydroxy-6-metoxy-1,4-benzoquinol methylase
LSAGIGGKGIKRLGKIVFNKAFLENLVTLCRNIAGRYNFERNGALPMLLKEASPYGDDCPICEGSGGDKNPLLPILHSLFPLMRSPPARFPDRTYKQCPGCGMVYMSRYSAPPFEYEESYFFESYKKQYGKTYLEDFPNLVGMAKKRLRHIKQLLGQTPGALLDIGCAYGPFLAAAVEEGFLPTGIDPAEDAVNYVRRTFAIPCHRGFFPASFDKNFFGGESFNAVTLWYVIEHFEYAKEVLAEIRRILKRGGVLAFSTPSFNGISKRKSRIGFLENSPADHYTIWTPSSVRSILARFGFSVKKIVITGHHPERFPIFGRFLSKKSGGLYTLLLFISKWLGLGDTFEVYAEKEADAPASRI